MINTSKMFLSQIFTFLDGHLIYLNVIGDRQYISINEYGLLKQYDQNMKVQREQQLVKNEQLTYLDQIHDQDAQEQLIIFKNQHSDIIMIRISILTLEVQVNQTANKISNIKILSSLSSKASVIQGFHLDNVHRVNYVLIFGQIIHLKQVASLDQYVVINLFKLNHYLIGQTNEMKVFVMSLIGERLYEIHIDQKYGPLLDCHQICQSIILIYSNHLITLVVDQEVRIGQIYDLQHQQFLVDQDKFVLLNQIKNRVQFLSFDSSQSIRTDFELQCDESLQTLTQFKMMADDRFIILYDEIQMIILFQFDQSSVLNKVNRENKQLPISKKIDKISPQHFNQFEGYDEGDLFKLIKLKRNLDLDELLNYIKRKGFYRCLLLVCGRIRNYDQIFKAMNCSELAIINFDTVLLRQCECFDKQYLREEFMKCIVDNICTQPMQQFLEYLVNHSHFIPDVNHFISILKCSTTLANKNLEIISRVKKQSYFFKTLEKTAKTDNFNIKSILFEKLMIVIKNRQQLGFPMTDSVQCWVCRINFKQIQELDEVVIFSHCKHTYHMKCLLLRRQTINNLSCFRCKSNLSLKLNQ